MEFNTDVLYVSDACELEEIRMVDNLVSKGARLNPEDANDSYSGLILQKQWQ